MTCPSLCSTPQPFSDRPACEHTRQAGFSLIEVSIVTAIVLLLAIIAIPAIGSYVIENKVPKVGEELARFVLQTQINAQPGSATPYATIATVNLANMVADSSLFSVTSGGKVMHGLGTDGQIQVSADGGGSGFAVSLDKVSHAACPALASVMQRISDTITIESPTKTATVKSPTVDYNALNAESSCEKGDTNTFTFITG